MKWFLVLPAFASSVVFGSSLPDLSESCKAMLANTAVSEEYAYAHSHGEVLASRLEGNAYYFSHRTQTDQISVIVSVQDPADGRSVRYRGTASRVEAGVCHIMIKRDDASACRYSTGDGLEGLKEIKGFQVVERARIMPSSVRTPVQDIQIKKWLGGKKASQSVAELIEGTDDQELSSALVILPDGRRLDYYGAYGGDNPIGQFFLENTADIVGDNGDDSICLK